MASHIVKWLKPLRVCAQSKEECQELKFGKNKILHRKKRGFYEEDNKNNRKIGMSTINVKELQGKIIGQYCHMLRKIQIRYILKYRLA